MAVHAVTLELPDEVYQRARRVAQTTRRPLEEVVFEWIRPPVQVHLPELEHLPNDELLRAARATLPPQHAHRLQDLLAVQQQRSLSEDEQQEAVALVEQEDFVTPRKARALFLIKQRGILPDELLLDPSDDCYGVQSVGQPRRASSSHINACTGRIPPYAAKFFNCSIK